MSLSYPPALTFIDSAVYFGLDRYDGRSSQFRDAWAFASAAAMMYSRGQATDGYVYSLQIRHHPGRPSVHVC